MSDAARHAAYRAVEEVYGETPANPAFTPIRLTGMSLGVQRSSLQSEELRPDRQISDFRLGTHSAAGDIPTELSFGTFDDFLEAATMGTWGPKAKAEGVTISAAASDSSFNDSELRFVTSGLEVGDVIETTGFADAANNGVFRVASVTASKIEVTLLDGEPATLVDETAGEEVAIVTTESVLKAGTVRRSFTILRHFTDIEESGDPYHVFAGVEINSMALAVTAAEIVTATFGTIGREGKEPEKQQPAGATFEAPTTTAPLDGFSGALMVDGSPVADVTELSLTLENGLEPRNVLGTIYTKRPSAGRSNLTGSATVYFEDSSFLRRFIREEDTSLSIELLDGEGNAYIFTVPRFKFTGGQPDISGMGAISLTMPFQGTYDPVTQSNIVVRRIPAI